MFVQFGMPVFDMVIMLGVGQLFDEETQYRQVSLTDYLANILTSIFLGFLEHVGQIDF